MMLSVILPHSLVTLKGRQVFPQVRLRSQMSKLNTKIAMSN
jgi:hypothetical protein